MQTSDIKNVKKIFLVGPSDKIKNNIIEKIKKAKLDNFKIFCFSGSVRLFFEKDIAIDYYSFFDPCTYGVNYDIFNSKFFKNTSLVIADLYKDELKLFYKYKNTTTKFKKEQKDKYHEFTKLEFLNKFKEIICIKPKNTLLIDSEKSNLSWAKEFNLFNYGGGKNFDKFSCFVMPIILNTFINLEEMEVVGFGDFDTPRYIGNNKLPSAKKRRSTGYSEYKTSFMDMLPMLKYNIALSGIKINFINKNFFSENLSTK